VQHESAFTASILSLQQLILSSSVVMQNNNETSRTSFSRGGFPYIIGTRYFKSLEHRGDDHLFSLEHNSTKEWSAAEMKK